MPAPQLIAALIALALVSGAGAVSAAPVDIGTWARALPDTYALEGVKPESAYLLSVESRRAGDHFTVTGGAPAWAKLSTESVTVGADGEIENATCTSTCPALPPPAGYLAGASLLSALRRHIDLGTAEAIAYGDRQVVCVDATRLGIAEPVLDPCFDTLMGAVLGQRHRLSGRFDGPSLDPWSVRFAEAGR
jgi:hypothetical protein